MRVLLIACILAAVLGTCVTQTYNGNVPGAGIFVWSNVSFSTSQGPAGHVIKEVVFGVYHACPVLLSNFFL